MGGGSGASFDMHAAPPGTEYFNSPRVHFMRNALAYAGKTQRRIASAWVGTAFAQDESRASESYGLLS